MCGCYWGKRFVMAVSYMQMSVCDVLSCTHTFSISSRSVRVRGLTVTRQKVEVSVKSEVVWQSSAAELESERDTEHVCHEGIILLQWEQKQQKKRGRECLKHEIPEYINTDSWRQKYRVSKRGRINWDQSSSHTGEPVLSWMCWLLQPSLM